MNTLRISSDENFESLFRPVIGLLKECEWLSLCDSFDYPMEWLDVGYDESTDSYVSGPIFEFELEVPKIEKRCHYYGHHLKKGALDKYSAAVSKDWSTLFAINESVPDALVWLQNYYEVKDRASYLLERVDAVVGSVDGSFWQVYLKNPIHAKILVRHLSNMSGVKISKIGALSEFIF